MKRAMLLALTLIGVLFFLVPAPTAVAQGRSFRWLRYDVDLTLLTDGSMAVTETQEIDFNGTYTQGFVTININGRGRNDGIRDIAIVDGAGRSYGRGYSAGEFYTTTDNDVLSITWTFFQPASGRQTYVLSYVVDGVVSVADNGDQLLWRAIREEHAATIERSTVTITMPPGVPIGSTTARVNDQEDNGVTTQVAPGSERVTFSATTALYNDIPLDVGVRMEHGLLPLSEPTWQKDERTKDTVSLLLIVVSLCLVVVFPLGLLALWYSRGRDPEPDPTPDLIPQPPDNLPPALVGTLLDEKADLHDILSTLIDLARRGYVRIEEVKSDFRFEKLEADTSGLAKHEALLLKHVFGKRSEKKLSSMNNSFYRYLPALRKSLYEGLVEEGLIDKSPEQTRGRYQGCGTVVAFGSIAAIFVGAGLTNGTTPAVFCIPVAGALIGVATLLTGRAMPRKTQKGATAAARWNAFKRYLQEIERHTDLNEAAAQFEAYLPYAVALGLERSWISKFRAVPTVVSPIWYIPRTTGRRGVAGGGAGAGGGLPSLDGMNTSLSGGLDSMSKGFTRMLDNTAKSMRSVPASSSSGGGGGGFSGGFSGGSSGGGSSGFR